MQYFFDSKMPKVPSVALLGGKGYNLHWLRSRGFNVPPFFVFTTDGFEKLAKDMGLQLKIDASKPQDEVLRAAKNIRDSLHNAKVPAKVAEDLHSYLAQPAFKGHTFFAVRSSAVDEDSSAHSFAGQMESYLFQKTKEDIERSLLACLASAFGERAIKYRLEKKIPIGAIGAAVVIQAMIKGEKSGVFFTAHPVNGSRQHCLITACYGLGEGIVSGTCNTDEYTVSHIDLSVNVKATTKDLQVVFDEKKGSGVMETHVPSELQEQPCLKNSEASALAEIGRNIAAALRRPQDIEWTIAGKEIFILQTRPITSLPPQKDLDHNQIVWDNSNIQESYCGVTTPLTFSFANKAYKAVYNSTFSVLKVPSRTLEEYQPVFSNLLGLIKGRIYYNINNWYKGLLLLPSFGTNKQDMERMMGLEDPVDFVHDQKLSTVQKLRKLPQLLRSYGTLISKFMVIDPLVQKFEKGFYETYNSVDLGKLQFSHYSELMSLTQRLYKSFFDNWQAPIINDFLVMMMNGKTIRAMEKHKVPNPAATLNNLLAGEEGIESTEPTKFLLRICDMIRKDRSLFAEVAVHPNATLIEYLKGRAPDIYTSCLEYIERYGDRCMGELKLESITLRQDPSFMFAVIKNYLNRDDLTAESMANKEKALRSGAEEATFRQIKAGGGGGELKKFQKTLVLLRKALKNREMMRMERTRMFGLFRSIFLEIGNQLHFYGHLADPRDIFYLATEELESMIDGRLVEKNLRSIVKSRKAEYAAFEQEEIDHHFITRGVAYLDNEYEYPYKNELENAGNGSDLSGTGCYPGIVEGSVRIIMNPNDELDLRGQILCTVRTDPGWAPLFPTVSGLLIERGSTLSHSAVVARELGIPAIVGIPNVTKILNSGDLVRMNGEQGSVEIIKTAKAAG
ncbi:MAG: phosphoenolpyruvate synthase [Oligoflexales bacterium]